MVFSNNDKNYFIRFVQIKSLIFNLITIRLYAVDENLKSRILCGIYFLI